MRTDTDELEAERQAHDRTMEQRDIAEEWADTLASLLAPPEILGEHSSLNNPWANAAAHAETEAARANRAEIKLLVSEQDVEHWASRCQEFEEVVAAAWALRDVNDSILKDDAPERYGRLWAALDALS